MTVSGEPSPVHFPFHIMVKPRGAVCNLECRYCYFLKKEALYPEGSFKMDQETLEQFTRQYITAQPGTEVVFAWQGGEPTLMGLAFFEKAVALQEKYRQPGMHIQNTLQTNGTLLDEAWCRFFNQHDFLVGLSMDGPESLHNKYRIDKGGSGTHQHAMIATALLKSHDVQFNILTTVHAANASHPLEVYRFLRDEVEANFIQFIPIVERDNLSGYQEGFRLSKRSVGARAYGDFLIAVFDEWVCRDVGRVFVQIFDAALGAWMHQPASLCIFAETCGMALALEHNGDLYACDHYVEPAYLLGNIHDQSISDLVSSKKQTQFGLHKRDGLPDECLVCKVRFVCNGGCPKNRVRKDRYGQPGLNYLCAGYKAFFNHIDRPMKQMAALIKAGHPAAEIMDGLQLV